MGCFIEPRSNELMANPAVLRKCAHRIAARQLDFTYAP